MTNSREQARAVMQEHWGHTQFRPGQGEAIEAVLDGRDVLAILPTGGGKSICYQVPALMHDGLTLVISPLIALMHDQVAGLSARGIEATFIDSTLSRRETDQRWTNAEHGQYALLYVAPERLGSDIFLARADRLDVSLLAIDEAHCVSEWGHHFRPAYLQIPEARTLLGDPPTLAVTATATPSVRQDVADLLTLREPKQIVRGFDRPNLVWSVFRTENKPAKVHDVIGAVEGSGILYAATRRGVEQWVETLDDAGEKAVGYHGGMSSEARASAQERWITGEVRLIVATNAFGMGIDKPDVRFVIHVDPPSSIEAYYQEAGRAGRDGRKAYAVLLYHPSDAQTQQALIAASHPTTMEIQEIYDAVCNLAQVPIGTQPDDPVTIRPEAVARLTGHSRGKIRNAVELLERHEAWQVLPRRRHFGLIRFEHSAGAMRRYVEARTNRALAGFVQTLLRTVHADAFAGWWRLDLRRLERRTGLERDRVLRGLQFLAEQSLIEWRPPDEALHVELTVPRSSSFPVDDRTIRQAERRAEKRLDHMLRYARSMTCRRRFLLAYFGEGYDAACGTCDVCLGRHRPITITPHDESQLRHIIQKVAEDAPRETWLRSPTYRTAALVDWLVQKQYLRLEDPLEEVFALTERGRALVDRWSGDDA